MPIRSREDVQKDLGPLAAWLHRHGYTPNQVTVAGFLLALAGAACYAVATPAQVWWLIPGAALLVFSLILDGADGVLARATGQSTPLGDYLDHVLDRYADVAVLLALMLTPWVNVWIGLAAMLGTLLTSYMGTQAHAVGIGRNYGGLVGRADRIVVLSAVPPIHAVLYAFSIDLPFGANLLELGVAWLAIGGNITALQRFGAGLRELKGRD